MDVSPKSNADAAREMRRRTSEECAARLTAAREAAGMTKAEAAKALGIPRSSWQDFEAGSIPDAVRGGEIEDMLCVPRGSIYKRADDDADDADDDDPTPSPEAA